MLNAIEPVQWLLQHFAVQKRQGGKRLVLGRGRHTALDRKPSQKRLELGLTHFARVALTALKDEAPNPSDLLGPLGTAEPSQPTADLVEQAWSLDSRRITVQQSGGQVSGCEN